MSQATPKNPRWKHKEHGFSSNPLDSFSYENQTQEESNLWDERILYWRDNIDKFADEFKGDDMQYDLTYYQRVYLRIMCRNLQTFITASRGTTKTYLTVLLQLLECVLYPKIVVAHVGPDQDATCEIVSAALDEIQINYPYLGDEFLFAVRNKTKIQILFHNGSRFETYGTSVMRRGLNLFQIVGEEVGQRDGRTPFIFETFKLAYLLATRKVRYINKKTNPHELKMKKRYITSASVQQHESYKLWKNISNNMHEGKKFAAIGNCWRLPIMFGVRHIEWYYDMKNQLTPDEWDREMESKWGGTIQNAIVRDETLTNCRKLKIAETKHCENPNVYYIISYDVANEEGIGNADCASVVLKCTEYRGRIDRRNKYKKDVVNVKFYPAADAYTQAKRVKKLYMDFVPPDDGKDYNETTVVVDAQNIGREVITHLMSDMEDGLPALSCTNNRYSEKELPNSIRCLYPLKASSNSSDDDKNDSDSVMVTYAQAEFENGNVSLLMDWLDVQEEFNKRNKRKDDSKAKEDSEPYYATKRLVGQIANLKKKFKNSDGTGVFSEKRISTNIQRDGWSALKYALRIADRMEIELSNKNKQEDSGWNDFYNSKPHHSKQSSKVRGNGRRGRIY